MAKTIIYRGITALACLAIAWAGTHRLSATDQKMSATEPKNPLLAKATFGGGCFWCLEAIYKTVDGVKTITSGYAGGHKENPTYKEVCAGDTGHAEVIQIEYDPHKVTYEKLLETFWEAHDPTTLNRQGNDVGTQYRSVIFYHDDPQRQAAEKSKAALAASGQFGQPIITEIKPLTKFYPAEDYHQDYYRNNPKAPYCQLVIRPKLEKLKKK